MKKLPLFILLQLIWIGLLVGGLWLYNNSISFSKSHPTTITIKNGNPLDSTLILEPDADLVIDVFKWRKVTWVIGPSSNVDSFRIEKKDDTSKQIFVIGLHPPSKYTSRPWGTINPLRRDGKVFSYNIFWKMKGDSTERKFDPKLAVKSTDFTALEWLIYIVYGILFILSFGVFRTKKASAK